MRYKGTGVGMVIFACVCASRAQLSDIVLLDDFGWQTYPSSAGEGCPDWVVSGKNVGTVSFFAGCGIDVASEEQGSQQQKRSLTAWFKFDVFTGVNPGANSRLRLTFSHKVSATASVDLSHASSAGGSSGSALGEIFARDGETYRTAPCSRSTLGLTTTTLPGTLVDGWKILPDQTDYVINPPWTSAGGQFKTRITYVVDRTHGYGNATSPEQTGCLVRAIGSAKGHFAYKSHGINEYAQSTPQGNLSLSGYQGEESKEVFLSFYNSTSTEVLHHGRTTIPPNGVLYFGCPLEDGTYDIYITVKGFLRKKFDNVAFANGTFSGTNATLLNGDINGDNTIDVGDYALISEYLNMNDGDSTWTRMGANFLCAKDCDLNGDGVVDVGDYAIVSANYNLEGDRP